LSNYLKPQQNSLVTKAGAAAIPTEILVGGALDIVKESIRCFTDYMKCREQEESERRRIAAQLRAINNAIDAQRESYFETLEKNHANVMEAYKMGNEVIKEAFKTGQMEMVKETYQFIIAISSVTGNQTSAILDNFSKGMGSPLFLK
jgi:signal transduction protein with GAF and PtsI domain